MDKFEGKSKLVFLLLPAFLVTFVVVFILLKSKGKILPGEEVHYHAGFQVYKDDKLVDFSDFRYMHIEPCSTGDHEEQPTQEEEQIEKAHLHDYIGDVVHVHREGVVWRNLFTNINYEISVDIAGYINGEKVDDALNYPINSYDSVVFFEGENRDIDKKLQAAVTKDRIVEAESRSENCGG
ncbi:hypothetical protein A2961_04985 [Candidatus Woesebacteria bacterium RIFCSPLOWO2_01_FULL_39_21]|uniref:Uncharacterized protein n=1 Tax=Candidatus Woesebacteria bacterium RIFCSPLOWO2_01_FULL_39_21 TaxID=1802519 RepID=A0A1F8BFL1_9BACT|nr:MAG: hypothetical protein A2691_03360 [Candidatus Woesebacteria bacterium RIFCSPHIGHO2_01_FULL_39_23]OGM62098.1 MAG: hypothetical protein A2961_04985 [Candidatus Woesebacteria bacterium RIFCSPLOWO2_01_FULL_39_21]